MIDKSASIALQAIESSSAPITESDLLVVTALTRKQLIKALGTLSNLGVVKQIQSSSHAETKWVDQSKYPEQKKIPFNPALISIPINNHEKPTCSISPEHKLGLIRSMSSIPFAIAAYSDSKDTLGEKIKYAYDRAFEKVLHSAIVQNHDEQLLEENTLYQNAPNSRILLETLKRVCHQDAIDLAGLERLNRLFSSQETGLHLGQIRDSEVYITGSLYVPVSCKNSISLFGSQILNNADRIKSPIDRAFYVHSNLMYLQPFRDANKRTSALASNGILLKAGLPPFSPGLASKENFLNAYLDYFEYGDTEAMSAFFCRSMVQSTKQFEACFDYYLEALKSASVDDIENTARDIVAAALNSLSNPLDLMTKVTDLSITDEKSAIESMLISEISSLMFSLDELANRPRAVPFELQKLLPVYERFKEESKFDSEINYPKF